MAFTEAEAIALGALSGLEPPAAMTVQQLCRATGLMDGAARRTLHRLSRSGLVLGTLRSPATWQVTTRGRLAANTSVYLDYLAARSRP